MHRRLCAVHTVQLQSVGNKPAAMTSATWERVSCGRARYARKASDRQSPCSFMRCSGTPDWKANVASPRRTVRRVVGWVEADDRNEVFEASAEGGDGQRWREYRTDGADSEAGTSEGKCRRAPAGQSMELGMLGSGIIRRPSLC